MSRPDDQGFKKHWSSDWGYPWGNSVSQCPSATRDMLGICISKRRGTWGGVRGDLGRKDKGGGKHGSPRSGGGGKNLGKAAAKTWKTEASVFWPSVAAPPLLFKADFLKTFLIPPSPPPGSFVFRLKREAPNRTKISARKFESGIQALPVKKWPKSRSLRSADLSTFSMGGWIKLLLKVVTFYILVGSNALTLKERISVADSVLPYRREVSFKAKSAFFGTRQNAENFFSVFRRRTSDVMTKGVAWQNFRPICDFEK